MLYLSWHIAAVGPTEPVASQVVSVILPLGTLYKSPLAVAQGPACATKQVPVSNDPIRRVHDDTRPMLMDMHINSAGQSTFQLLTRLLTTQSATM